MKIIKTWVGVCYFLLLGAGALLAQQPFGSPDRTEGGSFFDKVQETELYYQNRDKGRGSGYKQFKRWEHWQRGHLYPDGKQGSLGHANWNAFYHYQKQQALKNENGQNIPSANWQSKGMTRYRRLAMGFNGGLGRVNCLLIDPQNPSSIYAGTPAGGLWFSPNEGLTWQSLTDGLPNIGVSGITLGGSPAPGSRLIYLLSGDGDGRNTPSLGVFKSEDGGSTWMRTGLQWTAEEQIFGYKMIAHPLDPQQLFVVSTAGVYRSKDGALTWERVLPVYCTDLEFHPSNPQILYAAAYGRVFKSIDTGDTWLEAQGGLPPGLNCRLALAVSPAKPDYLYVLYGESRFNGQFEGLYRSEDAGLHFTLQSNAPNILGYSIFGAGITHQAWYDLALTVDPFNAEEVHVGAINCWKSTDGGSSWQNTSNWYQPSAKQNNYTHADIHDFAFKQGKVFCASDGGVYVAEASTLEWQDISEGMDITQVYALALFEGGDKRISFGSQDNGLNYFSNGEIVHWYGADGFDTYHSGSTHLLYGVVQLGDIHIWNEQNQSLSTIKPAGFQEAAWETPFKVIPQDDSEDLLYVGYRDFWQGNLELEAGRPMVSWTNLSQGGLGNATIDCFEIAPSASKRVYLSKFDQLFRSLDGGFTWVNITANLPINSTNLIQDIMVHPQDPNKVWICYGGYFSGEKVMASTDGGNTWINASGSLPNLPAHKILIDLGQEEGLYVGMDVGVYYKSPQMTDWELYVEGLPHTIVTDLAIDPVRQKLLAATFGRGIWESDLIQEPCPVNLVLEESLLGQQQIEVQESIETSSVVDSAATIQMDAGQEIVLKPGFFATSYGGGSFEAKIGGCDALLDLRFPALDLSGIYVGEMPGLLRTVPTSEAFSTEPGFWIYPNPSREVAHLEFNLGQDSPHTQIDIYTEKGQLVQHLLDRQSLARGNHALSVSVGDWPAGIYIFQIKTGREVISKKVMVLR